MFSGISFTSRSTLLLVTDSQIARIDFVGRRKISIQGIWTQAVKPTGDLTDWLTIAAAQATKLSPTTPGSVTLVSPLIWTEVLRLPADVIALSSPQELRHALAIEAEAESGISAFESEIAFTPLDSDDPDGGLFCTTLVPASLLNRLAQLIRSFNNARLHRLAHPVTLQLRESPQDTPAIIKGVRQWDDCPDEDERWLEKFANRWGQHLQQDKAPWPNGLSPTAGFDRRRMLVASGLISAVTAVGCAVWQRESRLHLDATVAKVRCLEQQQEAQNQTLAAIKGLENRLIKLRKETADAQGLRQSIEKQVQLATNVHQLQNARWSALLDALSDAVGDCWVQRIASDAAATSIVGIAPSNSQAHDFAARLEKQLRNKGWVIRPAASQELAGGLYEFTIKLLPDDSSHTMLDDSYDLVMPVEYYPSHNVVTTKPEESQT